MSIFMPNTLIYSRLYEWYEINRRSLPWRETEDPYAIWLSEIILQQTRVLQGLDYYRRFLNRWPTVELLAAADEAEVLREWQGLGYYSRARNLHKAAQMIVERQKSKVESQEIPAYHFPQTFEEIRALPGVGEYTAGAIASFAYNLPYPAMDGNVYRVVARLLDIDEPFDTAAGKKLFHKKIEELLDRDNPRLFNSAIMEFGALYCTPTLSEETCSECPLADFCLAHAHGTASLLPVRKPRPKVRDRWFDYHIYLATSPLSSTDSHWQSDRAELFTPQGRETDSLIMTLIRRRENPKDIWYHLYEFPCEELMSPTGEADPTAKRSYSEAVCEFTHVLSHQRIHARFIVHKVQKMPEIPGTLLIHWEELNDFALSRLTLRALDTLLPSLPR